MPLDPSNRPGASPRWNTQIEDELKRFPIYILTNQQIRQTTWHRQPGTEIHITHEGKGALVSETEVLLQNPRDVVIHQGGMPHQLITLEGRAYRRTVICFEPSLREAGPGEPEEWRTVSALHVPTDGKTYTALLDLCGRLEREIRERASGWEHMAWACLLEMTVLLRRHRLEAAADRSAPVSPSISQLVQQCMAYVALHLEEDLSLPQMARRFSLSEAHLTRSFRREIGVSFHQFVLAARIERGKQLLAEAPGLSVLDVALQAGFSSLAHFSSTFKSLVGESPSRYRTALAENRGAGPEA